MALVVVWLGLGEFGEKVGSAEGSLGDKNMTYLMTGSATRVYFCFFQVSFMFVLFPT